MIGIDGYKRYHGVMSATGAIQSGYIVTQLALLHDPIATNRLELLWATFHPKPFSKLPGQPRVMQAI